MLFDGWLPDSRHFAVITRSHIAGGASFERAAISVNSKSRVPFNGWLAPNGKTAIVPDQAGRMADYAGRDRMAWGEWTQTLGERKWFASSIASLKNYRLNALGKRPLTLQNKPFLITGEVISPNSYGSKSGTRPMLVQFAPNGEWALLRTSYRETPYYYLTSLSNGKTRKMLGTNAKFLSRNLAFSQRFQASTSLHRRFNPLAGAVQGRLRPLVLPARSFSHAAYAELIASHAIPAALRGCAQRE